MKRGQAREPGRWTWRSLATLPVALVLAYPVIVMVLGSVRPAGVAPPREIGLPPLPLAWENFGRAAELVNLPRALANSMLVALVVVPGSVVVASLAGFAILRMSRRARTWWVGIAVVAAMIPVSFLILGRFFLFRSMGITGTLLPLMLTALVGGSPLFVVFYVWAFSRVSEELFDAAEMEGASAIGTWWRIAMPLVRPVTVCVAMLAFLLSWNDFVGPLVYLSNPETFTVPLALRILSGVDVVNVPWLLAGAVLATIPVVFAFAVAQGKLVRLAGEPGERGS